MEYGNITPAWTSSTAATSASSIDFVVSPGADPRRITLEFDGAGLPTLGDSGDLVLRPEAGELRMRRPRIYQFRDGAQQPIIVVQQTGRVGFKIIDRRVAAARDRPRAGLLDLSRR